MNKEIKEMWIDALNSGVYEQGTEVLKTEDNKYCCLGVLCEIYANVHSKCGFDKHGEFHDSLGEISKSILPIGVISWAELKSDNPIVPGKYMNEHRNDCLKKNETSLAQLNDKGVPFSRIAEIIKKEL